MIDGIRMTPELAQEISQRYDAGEAMFYRQGWPQLEWRPFPRTREEVRAIWAELNTKYGTPPEPHHAP